MLPTKLCWVDPAMDVLWTPLGDGEGEIVSWSRSSSTPDANKAATIAISNGS